MPGKLSAYHAKRNFRITPEPRGEPAVREEQRGEHPHFVVQKHHARRLHYDFRLELDGTLKSWAVPKGPSLDPAEKRLAVHVEDHPLDYLEFEGDIPEHQYGAGHVEVWDIGWWEPQGDASADYKAGKLKFRLHGEKLHGVWTLVRTRLEGRGGKEQWLLIKERDELAHPGVDITQAQPGSALHPASTLPETLSPQLATLVDTIPRQGEWIYEVKLDGYRLLARVDGNDVRLYTRDGKDWSAKLPRQVEAIRALGLENAWLDGEIVVLDREGLPSFQLLQNAFDKRSTAQIAYYLFDLPWLNGRDLRGTPLAERRRLLEQVLAEVPPDILRYSAALKEPPQKLLDSACRLSMEGLIGKRLDAPYVGRRSDSWIKLKCRQRQEFVIGGYTEPQGTRKFLGALLLGVYEDGRLRYSGRVGTGFDRATLQSLHAQLKPLEQNDNPFDRMPPDVRRAGTHWVKPQLVAEISFAEWTEDGMLRQAVFHGLRADKPAGEIGREEAVHEVHDAKPTERDHVAGVAITHADRIIDPSSGLTKLDLARYYDAIAAHLLPWLKNRPVYLLRCPEGIEGERFFQKHRSHMQIPGVATLDPELDPGHAPLMVIESAHALAGAAQMGVVELHTCNATADRIDRPDCMVFDLDPDPALPWKSVVEGARLTKVVLDELGLRSFLKTSGGKGLHLVAPLARRHGWDEVAAFSQAVAQHMARTLPKLFSAKMGEKNRVGKIFIDYLRNRRQASTVTPWSARARPGLPVATPIAWEELDDIDSAAMWTIASLPARLKGLEGDPWQDYFALRQTLTAAMFRKLGIAGEAKETKRGRRN
jgi:bifunctional non-homologous end joining protein LigD